MQYFFEPSHIASVLFLFTASPENLEKYDTSERAFFIFYFYYFLNRPYLAEKALYRRRIVSVLKSIYDFLELIIIPLTDDNDELMFNVLRCHLTY